MEPSRHTLKPGGALGGFVLLTVAILLSGCVRPCNTRESSMSVTVVRATFRDPVTNVPRAGQPIALRVTAVRFTPNAPMTLRFLDYPAKDPNAKTGFDQPGQADGAGALFWEKSLQQLPEIDSAYDPFSFFVKPRPEPWNVTVTARETNGGCWAAGMISTRAFFVNPFELHPLSP